jgi:hypothetical protein
MRAIAREHRTLLFRHDPPREITVTGACGTCRSFGHTRSHFACNPVPVKLLERLGWVLESERYEDGRWDATMSRPRIAYSVST